MPSSTWYDAVVIGSGQAGGPLARSLAEAGRKTALIEREHAGGTCVNEGCTPTKTMLASARVAYLASRADEYGVSAGPTHVDLRTVRARKRRIVERFRGGVQRSLEGTPGLELLAGEARFSGPRALEVGSRGSEPRHLSAELIFINTGHRPSTPPVEGLDRVPYLDSTSIMELDHAPRRLLVLGGGYVAVEFGQMFRRFGSEVTLVQRGPQLLAREDPDVADALTSILQGEGVEVLLGCEAVRAESDGERGVRLVVRGPGGDQTLSGDHLLVATGRSPRTGELNLASAGVETDALGHIFVNERLETTAEGVYALGDVNGGPAFTHVAYDDYRVVRANLLEGGDRTTRDRLLPYTVFTDPQLGRVGLTEREARAKGFRLSVAVLPMSAVARAVETGETRGLMKAVVDADTGRILGCAVLGAEGGELAGVLQMAMLGGLPYTTLRDAVFSHPTLSESLNNLFLDLDTTS